MEVLRGYRVGAVLGAYLSARLQKSRMAGIAVPGWANPKFCSGSLRGTQRVGAGSATRAGWQPQGSSQQCHKYTQ